MIPLSDAERLVRVETEVKHVREGQTRIEKKLDDFIECADGKYASKTTERIVYALIGIVCAAVVYGLLHQIGL
jgi:hypothetical protein